MILVKMYVHWSPVTYAFERLSPKVGSIPAFHSVQQNINSLLKYFPYVYMHLSEQNRTEQNILFIFSPVLQRH